MPTGQLDLSQYATPDTASHGLRADLSKYAQVDRGATDEMERPDFAAAPPRAAGAHNIGMHEVNIVTGAPWQDEQPVRDLVRGMGVGIGQISTPGIAASFLHKYAPDIAAKLPKVKGYESTPVEKLPGQIITQGLMGMEGGLLEPNRAPMVAAGKLARPAPPPEAAVAPEQAKFTADLDKANAPYVKQLAADELSRQQGEIAGRVQQGTQQLHASVRGTLNQRWDALRGRMEGATVPTQPLTSAIEQSQKMLAGVPDDLKIFKEITHAIDAGGAEDLAGRLTETGVEPAQPGGLAFNDARIQASALGEKWASASGNLRRALKNVYDVYNKQLQATADAAGTGREYQALRDDWHQYVEDWQGRGPLNKVLNAPHQNYVTPQVLGRGSELLQQQLQRYPQGGAIAEDIASMRDVTKRAKVPPLKIVQPPEPPAPKPGFIARHAPRVIGKMVGGTVGGALGHPLIGYSVGGELGSELGTKLMKPKLSVPRTPEEYTRTILAAKEGNIPAGEADRLITRGGGRVGVIRRPSEPTQ